MKRAILNNEGEGSVMGKHHCRHEPGSQVARSKVCGKHPVAHFGYYSNFLWARKEILQKPHS